MRLYHGTDHAEAILKSGFKDGRDRYMISELHCGIWFSNVPLDANGGPIGKDLLMITIPVELIRDYNGL